MATNVSSREPILWRRQKLNSWLLLALVTVSSTACTAQISGQQPIMNASSQAEDSQAKRKPLRNLNPAPRQAVEVRVKVTGAPGPFELIEAAAQYDVVNAGACGKPQPISGAVPSISTSEEVQLTKVADGEYAGVVYVDRIIDEDYYGRGVCRWKFVEVRASFRASANPNATWFVVDLPAEVLEKKSSKKLFYWAGYYPNAEVDNYAEFGNASLEHMPAAKQSEFFEIEISAAGAQP